ncbi:MAG: T9SS type A sorting domain-containing protein [Candidatus Eisenbacteria bacterium]
MAGQLRELRGVVSADVRATGLDFFAVDATRERILRFSPAPEPSLTVDWASANCYAPSGSYPISFFAGSPPLGGWVDFYYDDVPQLDEAQAQPCFSAPISAAETSVSWKFSETPGGTPAPGTYYVFGVLRDSKGELVAADSTSATETVCISPLLDPGLAFVDGVDLDHTISVGNDSRRNVRVVIEYPDSAAAVHVRATFDPDQLEILGISAGDPWEGLGATDVDFESSYDNGAGTFELTSSATNAPIGLLRSGRAVAHISVHSRAILTGSKRFFDGTLAFDKASCWMEDPRGVRPEAMRLIDLDVRSAYLGDLASPSGAEGSIPALAPRPDGKIDFSDLMIFTLGWNGNGHRRDRIADLGPATGTAPNLEASPDGRWDIDDLVAFTTMYSWTNTNGQLRADTPDSIDPFRETFPLVADDFRIERRRPEGDEALISTRNATAQAADSPVLPRVTFEIPDGPYVTGDRIRCDLWCEDVADLTGAHIALRYDSTAFALEDVEAGPFLHGSQGSLFLPVEGTGWLDLATSKLDPERPGSSGRGAIGRLVFRCLRPAPLDVRLGYELRSSSNRSIATSTGQDGGEPANPDATPLLLVDSGFPNPITPTTTVTFTLSRSALVRAALFDVAGRRIRDLWNGSLPPGSHVLPVGDSTDFGRRLADGVYLLRIDADGARHTQKLIAIR